MATVCVFENTFFFIYNQNFTIFSVIFTFLVHFSVYLTVLVVFEIMSLFCGRQRKQFSQRGGGGGVESVPQAQVRNKAQAKLG